MPLSLKILVAVCGLMLTLAHAQPIYRVVDENGNVTYTDQKPSDEAEPMDLPEISVISETAPRIETIVAEDPASPTVEPFRMQIVEPAHGSIIANAQGQIDLRLESNLDIPPAAQIVVLVNDRPQPPVRNLEISLADLVPGEYELKAHLQAPSGRKLAESQTVSVRLVAADSG
ncbi:MAG: DUF4124 domain-containing protein [Wenzhouxiangella sp.]|jgi:hypothetical protein|nr:DUF4124 domain-containing protein [Wenzhouxiangella sp.]